ncbi:uncharacterized protein LOC129005525 [Macrosteles quadrilineatus]|uniref:uncharacterized protein LOC129005525 n=1 Tax=Macrosteles quadrilineatus TaxID=74068 RepID=UPI0023E2217F|nr:uncharacterized protein LOC129005525 [Macrosteles quadrilineatus]
MLLFADDAKIYKEVTTDFECEELQGDLDNVLWWCSENEMELNISKCVVLSFSRRTNVTVFNYTLFGSTLHRSSIVKDLGVTVSSNLRPEPHLRNMSKKAYSALRFVVRMSRDGFSPHALRTLYVQLVRPLLEYCSPVWSPYQICHVDLLEGVLRKFLRVLGVSLGFRYLEVPLDEMKLRFGLLPLSSRRKIFDLLLLKKIITASVDSPDLLSRVDFRCARVVRSRGLFERGHCSTQYSYHSALPRLHRLGNSLPSYIVLIQFSENHLRK